MTPEVLIYDTLKHLAGGRIWPDFAETDELPCIVYQVVGGEPVNYLTGEQPDKQKVRMQVSVWAGESRIGASELGQQVEEAIRAATNLQPEVATGRLATYDEDTKCRGTRQEFYIFA